MKLRDLLVRLMRNWPAKIISLAAAIIFFLFYRVTSLEERFFSVPVVLKLSEGYVPSGPYPKSARITLRGSEEGIFLIEEADIEVYVDLSAHTTEGVFRAPLEYAKSGTAQRIDPLEIRVEPLEATIELQREVVRSVDVVPVLQGFLEKGYELTEYYTIPESVQIEGPRTHVTGVEKVQTEPVVLSDKNSDFSIRLTMESSDPYISFVGGDSVEFVGVIRQVVMLRTYDTITIDIEGLNKGFTYEVQPVRGSVKVQGTQLFMEAMDTSEVGLSVDCSEITEAGQYTLPVQPDVPRELLVLRSEPETLVLEISGAVVDDEEMEREEEDDPWSRNRYRTY